MDSFLPPANAIAKPLHIQRVEKALNIGPFMKYAQNILTQTTIDDSDSQDSDKSESFPLIKKPYYGISKKGKFLIKYSVNIIKLYSIIHRAPRRQKTSVQFC